MIIFLSYLVIVFNYFKGQIESDNISVGVKAIM